MNISSRSTFIIRKTNDTKFFFIFRYPFHIIITTPSDGRHPMRLSFFQRHLTSFSEAL